MGRKKKVAQKAETVNKAVPIPKKKGRPKKLTKAKTAVPKKKKRTVKKAAVKKSKVKSKNQPIINFNENFEKFVENIMENRGKELLGGSEENLNNSSSSETNEYQAVEISMDSDLITGEDNVSCEVTEQFENLKVKDNSELIDIIEFDSIDNVITVDYQEETVAEEENEDSTDVLLEGECAEEHGENHKVSEENPRDLEENSIEFEEQIDEKFGEDNSENKNIANIDSDIVKVECLTETKDSIELENMKGKVEIMVIEEKMEPEVKLECELKFQNQDKLVEKVAMLEKEMGENFDINDKEKVEKEAEVVCEEKIEEKTFLNNAKIEVEVACKEKIEEKAFLNTAKRDVEVVCEGKIQEKTFPTKAKREVEVCEEKIEKKTILNKSDKGAEIIHEKKIEETTFREDEKFDIEDKTEVLLKRPEKSSRSKSKKQIDAKTQKKETKKKDKSKSKSKNSSKNKKEEMDDNSIRRSSRIKSISVLKKPSVGHGLVKNKDCESIELKTDSEKTSTTNQNYGQPNESNEKPIKVKSRWRRSSELEMKVASSTSTAGTETKVNVRSENEKDKSTQPVRDELVESRLKQFIHLKENSYLTERFVCKEAKKMTCDCFLTDEEIQRGEMACGEDCLNRLLMIECGNLCPVGDRCANKKFQKGQFAPVEAFNTHKKGLGLRAAANIPYGEFILEYVGEVLNADEFDKRAEEYSQDKNQHYYFMSLRSDGIIDATQKGNISRFINHSCEPNAETQKWTVNGELRIGFFSTRTILAGEEVTFDYRFERYGKEAQKCFCEAPSCRGWLGEEPDDEEDEEEEEEEEEDEIETSKKIEVPVIPKLVESKEVTKEGEEVKVNKEIEEAVVESPITPKVKKSKPRRKLRKELFEDDQLDEEIEMLMTTGLKNQAHTLKLSRLILRAKEPAQRAKLLKVLRRGELPCRRLFLDYHGLRLMHGYMTDAQCLCISDKKYDSLRLEMLQTLAVLPIPNKSMLQDSKVLPMVEKWSKPLVSTVSPPDSESNSPKNVDSPAAITPPLLQSEIQSKEEIIIVEEEDKDDDRKQHQSDDLIRRSVSMDAVKSDYSYFTNTKGTALAEEIVNIFEDDAYVSCPNKTTETQATQAQPKQQQQQQQQPATNYEEEITALASKLLEAWSNLKEVFRIPKKERIEQMKEHEREANKGYIAGLGLEQDADKRNETRYRGMQRYRQPDKKTFRQDDRWNFSGTLSKHNRRKLFALQVEQQEEERRRKQRELWRQHERNCMLIGTDPRFTAPFDPTRGYQCIWNPQIGQWQNYPLPTSAQQGQGQGQSPMGGGGYGQQIPGMPNTNLPPPNIITGTAGYPYGLQQMQIPGAMSAGVPPIPSGRLVTPGGRPPLPNSVVPPSMSHQSQSMIPNINTNMPPPPALPQHAPSPSIYQTTGYSPQMLVGQTQQSPVMTYQQQQDNKKNEIITMIGDVKFLGPIPPPAKLPPKWKCATDKYGRPYYYHIRLRRSQWEPPPCETPPPEEDSDSSSSESSSSSCDSSSDDSDSDDEIMNDSRLLRQVRRQMDKQLKMTTSTASSSVAAAAIKKFKSKSSKSDETAAGGGGPMTLTSTPPPETETTDGSPNENESSIDKRLKEQFNLTNDETPPTKKKKTSLVEEIIISPRTEEDKLQFREDLKRYRENKEMLKKQKEIILQQTRKHLKEKKLKQQQSKAKLREMKYSNTENAKRIKENFRSSMANTVVNALNAHRKSDCKEGRITNTEDFKHLARKLTHFVMLKEMKYISEIEELVCSDNVKAKARDYIRKYMNKFGEVYVRRDDEPEHYY